MSPIISPPPDLADLTTMRVGGPPLQYHLATTRAEIIQAAHEVWAEHDNWFVLGGGSNVVAPGTPGESGFQGAVLHVAAPGIERRLDSGRVALRVSAGETWDDLVALSVREGWSGIEALSGVPGSAGAAPIQNIGAYGQELSAVLTAVECLDERTGQIERLTVADLEMSYRSSILKRGRRTVVLSVELELEAASEGIVAYEQLAKALDVPVGTRAPLARIRDAVLELRRTKGMVLDPADPASVSCGSFFINPIVPVALANKLPADAPRWPIGTQPVDLAVPLGEQPAQQDYARPQNVKLSAAWLIEAAGIPRGFTLPGVRAGVSPKHSLAIVNLGGASAQDVIGMATYIQTRVAAQFGVVLEPEPVILG